MDPDSVNFHANGPTKNLQPVSCVYARLPLNRGGYSCRLPDLGRKDIRFRLAARGCHFLIHRQLRLHFHRLSSHFPPLACISTSVSPAYEPERDHSKVSLSQILSSLPPTAYPCSPESENRLTIKDGPQYVYALTDVSRMADRPFEAIRPRADRGPKKEPENPDGEELNQRETAVSIWHWSMLIGLLIGFFGIRPKAVEPINDPNNPKMATPMFEGIDGQRLVTEEERRVPMSAGWLTDNLGIRPKAVGSISSLSDLNETAQKPEKTVVASLAAEEEERLVCDVCQCQRRG